MPRYIPAGGVRGFTLTGALGVKELADDSGYTVIKPSWDGVQQRIIEAGYESVFCHPKAFLSCNKGRKVFQSPTCSPCG